MKIKDEDTQPSRSKDWVGLVRFSGGIHIASRTLKQSWASKSPAMWLGGIPCSSLGVEFGSSLSSVSLDGYSSGWGALGSAEEVSDCF